MKTALRIAGLTAAALLSCTACLSEEPANTANTAGPAPGSAPAPSPTSTYTPTHSVGEGPQAPTTRAVPPHPTWLPRDQEAAKEVALSAMIDFARPDMDKTEWANDFARWLTPKAIADYSAVDPANIPVTEVTGPATLTINESNGFGTTASVPTDIGTYTVQLLRQGQNEPWKVNRLTPPK